ncbi:unnamed protein product [Brassica oleracea var. botrytis]
MRKLRQFHRRRLDSGGWRLSKPCVAGFWISIFIHGGLSANKMEVLDFLIMCLPASWLWMRYRC